MPTSKGVDCIINSVLFIPIFGLHLSSNVENYIAGNNKDTTKHFSLIESDTSGDTLQSAKLNDSSELPVFDFDSMLVATNHFSITNKLGQGGFGPVYKVI